MSFFEVLSFVIFTIYVLGKLYQYSVMNRMRHIKTNKMIPSDSLFLEFLYLITSRFNLWPAHEVYPKNLEKYGPVMLHWTGLGYAVIVGDPEISKQVWLNTKEIHKKFPKFNPHFTRFLGENSISFVNGDTWKRQRSVIERGFVSFKYFKSL